MSFTLQQIPSESKFCQQLRAPLLERSYPREVVSDLLTRYHGWEKRERKLSQLVMVYYIIALSLWRQYNVTEVFAHLCRGLRWLWPDDSIALPTGGALTARRQSLGSIVLRHLFRQCCRPLASEATKGAFAMGLRLMAVDGTLDDVPDSPANALHAWSLDVGQKPESLSSGALSVSGRGGNPCHRRCRSRALYMQRTHLGTGHSALH